MCDFFRRFFHKSSVQDDVAVVSMLPIIQADLFVSVGVACRPSEWLRAYGLRRVALPFDWMMGYALDFVLRTFDHPIDDWFCDYVEEPSPETSHNRWITDRKYNMTSLHHFAKGASVESQLPEFHTTFMRYWARMLENLSSKENICFLSNRTDSVADIKKFMAKTSCRFPNIRQLTLVNIRHSNRRPKFMCYNLSRGVRLYDITLNDTHRNGNNPNFNPDFWLGNDLVWSMLCRRLVLLNA